MGDLKFAVQCTSWDTYYVDSDTLTNEEIMTAIRACENDPWQAEQEYDITVTLSKSCDPDTDQETIEWDDEYEHRKNKERLRVEKA